MKRSEVERFLKGLDYNIIGQSERGVWIADVHITPNRARVWLDRNAKNRTLSETRAAMYARDMESGAWEYNHEALAFGPDFELKDGQHRLTAIDQSGATRMMRVEFNHHFTICDKARPRSSVDIRRIAGQRSDGRYVATIKSLANIDAGDELSTPCSDAELIRTEGEYGRELKWVSQYMKRGYPAVFYAALCFAYGTDPTRVDEFASRVVNLTNMTAGSPAAALARWITSEAGKSVGAGSRKEIMLKTLTMLRKHILGEMVERVHSRAEIVDWFRTEKEAA